MPDTLATTPASLAPAPGSPGSPAPGSSTTRDTDPAPLREWQLTVCLRIDEQGEVVTREPVTRADLDEVITELIFHGGIRRGHLNVKPGDGEILLEPTYVTRSDDTPTAGGADQVSEADAIAASTSSSPTPAPSASSPDKLFGYVLAFALPDGETYRRQYTIRSLSHVAERAVQRLIGAGRIEQGDAYHYELVIERGRLAGSTAQSTAATTPSGFKVARKDPPLNWLRVPLEALLKDAERIGEPHKRRMTVVYTRDARRQAEQFSRLGMRQTPAVETGAALVGTLCACPDSHELFAIVTRAIQIQHADAAEMTLEYTSASWQRIHDVLDAMQTQLPTMRLLGQAHGHNFLPANGAEPCAACAMAKECSRTSVFASTEDLHWTRCVFPGQPFALCHIFGVTARHNQPNPDEVESLFGISDGRLLPRDYAVIETFNPAAWEVESSE